ncbi:MAG: hypothetical protein AAB728_05100 [Patescibacteria group bacterium]
MREKGTIDNADYYAIAGDPAYVSFGRSFLEDVGNRLDEEGDVMRKVLQTFLASPAHEEYAAIFGFVASNGHHEVVLTEAMNTLKRHDVRSECGALGPMLDHLPPGATQEEFRRAIMEVLDMCAMSAEKPIL